MALYLLDTNIASCIIKGTSPAVDRRVAKTVISQLAPKASCGLERYGCLTRLACTR
jgi:predicted nucleic acid-binding protein